MLAGRAVVVGTRRMFRPKAEETTTYDGGAQIPFLREDGETGIVVVEKGKP